MKKILFLLSLVTCVFASCVQQEYDDSGNRVAGPDDVTFNITLPSATRNTRAVEAVNGENKVNNLTLLFFAPSDDKSGVFKGYHPIAPGDLKDSETFQVIVSFDSSSGLNKSDEYNFVAIANMLGGNYFADVTEMNTYLDGLAASGKTEAEVRRELIKFFKGQGLDSPTYDADAQMIKSGNIPMSGTGKKEKKVDNAELNLTRTVVRFDVVNAVADYTLSSVAIWNAFSYPAIIEGESVNYDQGRTKRFYGIKPLTTTPNEIRGGLYAPENVSANPTQNDAKTTCLIIGLTKNGDTKFFRVNVHPSESGQYLRRNNVYQVTVSKVNGEGKDTEQTAYETGEASLEVSINSWDRDEDGLIISNGNKMMALPTTKAVFGPQAEKRVYSIYTLGTSVDKLTMKIIGGADGSDNVADGITAVLNGNMLTITAGAYGGDVRRGVLEFSFAGMKGTIEVVQDGTEQKQLKLSHTAVPNYPAGGSTTTLISNPIKISSSGAPEGTPGTIKGPWTATILFSNGFSFDKNTELLEMKGVDGDEIKELYALAPNDLTKARVNFILVTLDADPANYRNVIVLTQNVSGNFTINPNVNQLQFNADKSVYANQNDGILNVISGTSTDTWNIELTGTNADKFKLEKLNAAGSAWVDAGSSYVVNGTSEVSFRVSALGENFYGLYRASVVVTLNGVPTTAKTVIVTQDAYRLTISPSTITVPAKGGTATFSVVFAGANKTMSATLVNPLESMDAASKYKPTFANTDDDTFDNKEVGNFVVNIPPINAPFGHLLTEKPQTKVKVKIDGTLLEADVIVEQELMNFPSSLNTQTLFNSYGRWSDGGGLMMAFPTFMKNPSLFGPSATVWAPSLIGGLSTINYTSVQDQNVRIWNVNQLGYNPAYTRLSSNWSTPNSVVVLSTYYETTVFGYIFNGGNGGYSLANGYGNPGSGMSPSSAPDRSKTTKLWKYLVEGEGPFGAVTTSNITNLGGGDAANIGLTAWPSTFIPLIMASNNTSRCIVGVDPVNRVIWVGDTDVFNSDRSQNQYGNLTSDSSKFLQNLIAYMINVALYGDAFNDQFKVK